MTPIQAAAASLFYVSLAIIKLIFVQQIAQSSAFVVYSNINASG